MCYPMGSFWACTRPSLLLHMWFFLSCVLTSSGCKCLFVVYAFVPWEALWYKSFLVSHDVAIYCMMELQTSLRFSILHPRHHSSWTFIPLPFLLGYFFIAGRLYINDVTQQCHITTLCLRPLSFFERIIILFFILDSFLSCHHLFFGTSLILLFL